MKLVKPKFEIIEQPSGIEGIYKMVEIAGRTCYKSENKITENSAKEFVQRMLKAGHLAMLEHGTVYLAMPMEIILPIEANGWGKYTKSPYSKGFKVCEVDGQRRVAITTNLRVLVKNGWLDDLKYICEPTKFHEKRYCVRFTCDRGVSHEFVRHRVFSFAMESTRYCNYSKDKFNNEITFVIPTWLDLKEGHYLWEDQNPLLTAGADVQSVGYDDSADLMIKDENDGTWLEYKRHYENWMETETFMHLLQLSEQLYFDLLNLGWKPQQARQVLPNALKTELIMTGFIPDWEHFFELRCSEAAHPQARELAIPLRDEFIKRGYIK